MPGIYHHGYQRQSGCYGTVMMNPRVMGMHYIRVVKGQGASQL